MAFWNGLKNIFKKESRITTVLAPLPEVEHMPKNYFSYFKAYNRNPYLRAAIDLIAKSIASIEILLYANNTEIEQSQYLDLVYKPNPYQNKSVFLQSLARMSLITGNAFIEIVRVGNTPKELYVLRTDRVFMKVGKRFGEIDKYVYSVDAQKVEFEPQDILHVYLSKTQDDWFGDSPLDACSYSVDMNDAAREWNTRLLQNGARPMGALISQHELTDDQLRILREQFATQYASARNAGKPLILQGGLDWKEIGLTPNEMSWQDAIKITAREIAIVFGVPPELLGEPEYKTYSNFQEARRQFFINTVIPIAEIILEQLNKILPNELEYRIDYDEIEALQEDRNVVWQQVLDAVSRGVLTINEARERLGYTKISGADSLLVNASLIPLGSGYEEEI